METVTAARPVWFGEDRRLFGMLHIPDSGRARAGVVICPSLGSELLSGHPALRELAERFAAAGFVVLRFDYEGTGDSYGSLQGPQAVPRMRRSVRAAAEFLLHTGVRRVAAVGLRFGATLAAAELAGCSGVEALALIDPLTDGARFLREHASRYRLTVGEPPDDGGVHTIGFRYDGDVAAGLREVRLPPASAFDGVRVAVVIREERHHQAPDDVAGLPNAEAIPTTEMGDLLDISTVERRMPHHMISAVCDWLEGAFDRDTMPVAPTELAHTARMNETVEESFVSLGPLGLFGIEAKPLGPSAGPPIVLLNTGTEQHIGPGRLWVELSRTWASGGRRVLRVDLAGLGESAAHPGQGRDRSYAPDHLGDLAVIATAVQPAAPDDVLPIGLCSGAVHALEWAVRVGAPEVVAINPVLSLVLPPEDVGDPPVERYIPQVVREWLRPVHDAPRLARLKAGMPSFGWRLLDLLGLHRSPTVGLERVVDKGVRLVVIAGPDDAFAYQHRGAGALRRMARTGRFDFRVIDGVDHGLQAHSARVAVTALLTERLAPASADPIVAADATADATPPASSSPSLTHRHAH